MDLQCRKVVNQPTQASLVKPFVDRTDAKNEPCLHLSVAGNPKATNTVDIELVHLGWP